MTDPIKRCWELVKEIDYCVLVSSGEGEFLARPMSSIVQDDAELIYFLSNGQAKQIDDLSHSSDVLLSFAGNNTYLCIRGSATVSHDRDLIKRLWNADAQVFWPEGPEAADAAVIAVEPEFAEYWEGSNAVVTVARMATALVTGKTPDLGTNEKVRF